jgi:hypothetical protein
MTSLVSIFRIDFLVITRYVREDGNPEVLHSLLDSSLRGRDDF